MARAFWKGAISFGMVVIPVKMYVATQSQTLAFHLLHKKCLTRPRQVLYCEADNEYFSAKETVRGFEYVKGQYVVLDEKDFEKVPVKTAHAIDIRGFVEAGEIDPVYYHASHYLEPEELGVKPFALLREALVKTGRVGIAKVSFQRREHLGCLRPLGDIMALHTMYYHDEVLSRSELNPPKQELKPEELELATSLVNSMARSFKPDEYEDKYRLALKQLIEAKVRGEEIKAPRAPKVEVPDLMSALRASLAAAAKKGTKEKEKAAVGAKE
ncbi:MAG: Ku protein [Chloroflexota bacterium]|nr:Ku protein [Chloroflexota bacterium]